MTTIAAAKTTIPTVRAASLRRPAVWVAMFALVVAAALAVWIVVASSTHHTRTTAPAQVTTGQFNGQPANQLCAPAPGTRFC